MAAVVEQPRCLFSSESLPGFASAKAAAETLDPAEPIYCLYPRVQHALGRRFVEGFPGRVLYAVKANPDPQVLRILWDSGIRDFDTASLTEVEAVKAILPEARCHFMAPVRLPGAAKAARERFGVTTFVIDHASALELLLAEVGGGAGLTIFVRLAASNAIATYDLSTKFGATPEAGVELLKSVAESGAKPALAFNVGSLVVQPEAYRQALETCRSVLQASGLAIEQLDVGGGYPSAYPGIDQAPLDDFFQTIGAVGKTLPLAPGAELWGEPGRALVCEGLSLLARVLLRKDKQLYLNDGIYGSLAEAFLSDGLVRYPSRSYRPGGTLSEQTESFTLYGPTCDSLDKVPAPFDLPADLQPGDFIEFGMLGAYSISCRTRFNGFHPERMVAISDPEAEPPYPGK